MGLDMYLYGIVSNFGLTGYNIGQVKTMIEVGYWRKANAIHKWFVDNRQDGIDNCATYYIDKDDLIKLKELCEKVMKNPEKAEELLPVTDGFFFGSQEYDEWYFNDIQETIEIIDWALKRDFDYFAYQSSW